MSGSFVPLHFTFDDLPKKPKLQIQTVYGPITPHEIGLVAAAFRLVIAHDKNAERPIQSPIFMLPTPPPIDPFDIYEVHLYGITESAALSAFRLLMYHLAMLRTLKMILRPTIPVMRGFVDTFAS